MTNLETKREELVAKVDTKAKEAKEDIRTKIRKELTTGITIQPSSSTVSAIKLHFLQGYLPQNW